MSWVDLCTRKTREDRLREISRLSPEQLIEYIGDEVVMAFEAGYLRFNAATNEALDVDFIDEDLDSEDFRNKITLVKEFPQTGPVSIFPNLYKQAKGL